MSSPSTVHDQPPAAPTKELATFGPVHLNVVDVDRSLRFWRDLIGLEIAGQDTGVVRLGTDADTLLVLHPNATSPLGAGTRASTTWQSTSRARGSSRASWPVCLTAAPSCRRPTT